MTDQKSDEVVEKAVETETTETSSPQVESPITGDKTDVKVSDDQGTVADESDDVESRMSPEARRAFQEQRLEIKRLKEGKDSESESSAFDAFNVPTPSAGQPMPLDVRNFQDPITGETNWTAYNQAQQAREQEVIRFASQNAQAMAEATIQDKMDEAEARRMYPDLMNDPKTEKLIAAQWFMDSKFAGKPVSITKIAGEFARNFKQAVTKAEKIGAEKALNEVSEKEQAGLAAQSQTQAEARSEATAEEVQDLSFRTRKGDENAVLARLSKIPWANK
jgi:hypothetical protein